MHDLLAEINSPILDDIHRIGIVLAAGHGKRIRSETSKMLHEIWGQPTAVRVARAVQEGLDSPNQVIIVGIKGADVARAAGPQPGRLFAYQANPVLGRPAGTGDAVRVGLQAFPATATDRDVYIFLGDMGLLTGQVVAHFRASFDNTACDMMVLTGLYSGPADTNSYGRIVRVPATDAAGQPAGADRDKVIEIREHKDILSLDAATPYEATYNGPHLRLHAPRAVGNARDQHRRLRLQRKRATDVHPTPRHRQCPRRAAADRLGANLQSAPARGASGHGRQRRGTPRLQRQKRLVSDAGHSRRWAYEKLKDTITIADEEDFFIADEVIEQILNMDAERGPLDIVIGKGVYIGPEVQLNRRVAIGDRSYLSGHLVLGEGVQIGVGVELSTYLGQTLALDDEVEVLSRNIIKGNLRIGAHSRIESGVLMTGSDEHPMRVGERVTIKGTSYLYGCQIDDDLLIEHSVIKCKRVEQARRRDGTIQPIRYVLPQPEGLDSIADL